MIINNFTFWRDAYDAGTQANGVVKNVRTVAIERVFLVVFVVMAFCHQRERQDETEKECEKRVFRHDD
ncbi:MAG: hypothetical protein HUK16_07830 [Bacteroidales bacterium]|nr:hypothetical protein [Bacteroidales bacterium]